MRAERGVSIVEGLYKLGLVISAIDRLTGPARKMGQAIANLEKSALRAKKALEFGKTMTQAAAVTAGAAFVIGAGLGRIVAPVVEVEEAMAPLRTVITSTMGSIDTSMAMSKKAAMDWARAHTDSAAEFLRAQYQMASAGLNDVQSLEGTRVALTVAKATMGDQTEAANLLATAYNNVGDTTKPVAQEMTRLGDILTKTQQFFQFKNLGQLTEGLQYAVPAAKGVGTSFEEVNVILGQLNNTGLQGSMAGTAFAATLRQMLKASEDLGFQLARDTEGNTSLLGTLMNIQAQFGPMDKWSDKLRMKFQSAFGEQGMSAIALLLPKIQDMRGALGQVADSAGAAAAAQKTMESTLGSQWRIALNNLNEVKMQLGDNIAPILQGLLPTLRGWVDGFKSFSQAHPTLTRTIVLGIALTAVIFALVAPILMAVGSLLIFGGAAMHGFLQLRDGAELARGPLGRLGKGVLWLARTALPRLITTVWSFTAALLANPATWVIVGLMAIAGAIYLVIRYWDQIKAAVTGALAWVYNALQGVPDWLLAAFPVLLVIKHWDDLKAAIASAVDWITGLAGRFYQSGQALWQAFIDGLKSVLNGPVEVVKAGLQKVRNLLPFSDAKEGPLSTLTRSGAAMLQTFAGGIAAAVPDLRRTVADGLALGAPGLALAGGPAIAGPVIRPSAPAVTLAGVMDAGARGSGGAAGQGARPMLAIYGDVTIRVEKMDHPDDFMAALRRFAAQEGR